MTIEIAEKDLQKRLGRLFERVINDQEIVVIRRRGHRDVAMLLADEWRRLRETASSLSSPHTKRLLRAGKGADSGASKSESVSLLSSKKHRKR